LVLINRLSMNQKKMLDSSDYFSKSGQPQIVMILKSNLDIQTLEK